MQIYYFFTKVANSPPHLTQPLQTQKKSNPKAAPIISEYHKAFHNAWRISESNR